MAQMKILMVCLGNICRSPLAQGILESKVDSTEVIVDSAGTAAYHVGNSPDKRSVAVAKKNGIGLVGIRNSNHFGIAGYHAMKALPQDMIGMAMTNATPFIPPTHSKQAMLGTNPISYAFPTKKEKPLVIDLATSSVARGKIEIARREGKEIPKGWVLDKNGKTSQNVDELKDGGMLTPLGSLEELGSHKGYALAQSSSSRPSSMLKIGSLFVQFFQ